ncbi:MAG TPA: SUMF1/EgtB/PvdO family nonheme iron enzyme [Actinomycetota bacterium]|nr:SUMF1/EgtB/PvdO family nonheme iron enzyme [Actinomycetota bacterium]
MVGKSMPTEVEWEFAARSGLPGATFVWSEVFAPNGKMKANTWQGEFPWQNLLTDRFDGHLTGQELPPNGYGLYDMAGNVWEWTSDYFRAFQTEQLVASLGTPRATSPEANLVPGQADAHIPRRVIKGGSLPCAPSYCLRYRPAARQSEAVDISTAHIGFRCVVR